MMGVQLEHAFVGCNRQVHALDWGQGGLIAYTAHNAVVIAEINVCDSNPMVEFLYIQIKNELLLSNLYSLLCTGFHSTSHWIVKI